MPGYGEGAGAVTLTTACRRLLPACGAAVDSLLELQTNHWQSFQITEEAPTKVFYWLKTAFTFKNLFNTQY